MTIKDYMNNYVKNSNYSTFLIDGNDDTVATFFNNCIKRTLPQSFIDNAIQWHKMFMEYIKDDSNIFWVRKFESGGQNANDNRRACLEQDDSGFTYAYVSNYDAQEIFNMISCGVLPDLAEFVQLMKSFLYKMHFDKNKCAEAKAAAFENCEMHPKIGGVMNRSGWYFAHIHDVNNEDYIDNGTKLDDNNLFIKADINTFKLDANLNRKVHKLGRVLSNEEKKIIKAHFLRFVDPLNYFLVPKRACEVNSIYTGFIKKSIGEYPCLQKYIASQYYDIYQDEYIQFCEKALVELPNANLVGDEVINVAYRALKPSSQNAKKASKTSKAKTASNDIPKLIFVPSDLENFKKELLSKKEAFVTWKYKNQEEVMEKWNASRFNPQSDVLNNVRSKPRWRSKDVDGLIEVIIEIR